MEALGVALLNLLAKFNFQMNNTADAACNAARDCDGSHDNPLGKKERRPHRLRASRSSSQWERCRAAVFGCPVVEPRRVVRGVTGLLVRLRHLCLLFGESPREQGKNVGTNPRTGEHQPKNWDFSSGSPPLRYAVRRAITQRRPRNLGCVGAASRNSGSATKRCNSVFASVARQVQASTPQRVCHSSSGLAGISDLDRRENVSGAALQRSASRQSQHQAAQT